MTPVGLLPVVDTRSLTPMAMPPAPTKAVLRLRVLPAPRAARRVPAMRNPILPVVATGKLHPILCTFGCHDLYSYG
jgi:hypothetical protein